MDLQPKCARSIVVCLFAAVGIWIGGHADLSASDPPKIRKEPAVVQKIVKPVTTVVIVMRHPGMPAEWMEHDITDRLERAVRQAEGVGGIESKTSLGLTVVQVHFQDNITPALAMAQAAGLTASVVPHFPAGTAAPELFTLTRNASAERRLNPASLLPACLLVIDDPAMSLAERADSARLRILPDLASLPDISARLVPATSERVLAIMLDPDKLRAYNLAVQDVSDAVESALAVRPAGNVRIGDKEMLLKGGQADPAKLDEIPIKGMNVYLRDVGKVVDSSDVATSLARVNGRRQVWVAVHARKGSAAAVRLAVRDKLPDMQRRLPAGAKLALLSLGTGNDVDYGLITVHLRAPGGARLEVCEQVAAKVEKFLEKNIPAAERRFILAEIGPNEAEPLSGRIGPDQATLRVQLVEAETTSVRERVGKLRRLFRKEFPSVHASFHTGAGLNWPVVVHIGGGTPAQGQKLANQVRDRLAKLRPDADVDTPEQLPALRVEVDRVKAGQLGMTVDDVQRALVAATATRSYGRPMYWRDAKTGLTYKVLLMAERAEMHAVDDLAMIPVQAKGARVPVPFRDVAKVQLADAPAVIEHFNLARIFSVRVNTDDADPAALIRDIENDLKELSVPTGMRIKVAR